MGRLFIVLMLRRTTWILSSVLLLGFLYSMPAQSASRVALVVGNSAYLGAAALKNPSNDANAIAELFKSIGFDEVKTVVDATRIEFEVELDEFHALAKNAEMAVFFYAGHAIQWRGRNYMMPVDITLNSERDLKRLVSLDSVVEDVSAASRIGMVILDACRDNPFLTQLSSQGTRGFERGGLATPPGARGTLVAFATQADAVAYDGKGRHSPYTAALLKHLPTPNKDISLVLRAVRDEVGAATDWKQQPFTYGSLSGGDPIFLVHDEDAPNDELNLQVPSEPPAGMAKFTVSPRPSDSRVRILKPEMPYAPGMLLPLGQRYEIMVSRKGFRAIRKTVDIDSDHLNVHVSLKSLDEVKLGSLQDSSSGSDFDVAVIVSESGNFAHSGQSDALTIEISKTLSANGISVFPKNDFNVDAFLNLVFNYSVTRDSKYNAYNADCSARYTVENATTKQVLKAGNISVDPAGGFSSNEVVSICRNRLKAVVKKGLLGGLYEASRTAAKSNKLQLSVRVIGLVGSDVPSIVEVVRSVLHQVGSAKVVGFNNGELAIQVIYGGEVFEFVESVIVAGSEKGLAVELEQVKDTDLVLAMSR